MSHDPEQEVGALVEHLFRHEAGKIIAVLTRIFGTEHLTLAEDVVQEALSRALQTWPYRGVPENPGAWLMRASRNLALDVVRRDTVFRNKEPAIALMMGESGSPEASVVLDEDGIKDDRLRMMFVCSHPLIAPDDQAALALRVLCGFNVEEIASAFLTTEAAVAKRLTRAKQRIKLDRVPFELPPADELGSRLDGVLRMLYLLFNEGYKASSGGTLVREDITREAIRLTTLLVDYPAANQPRTHALLALMYLTSARFPARVSAQGELVRLQDQDRALWDGSLIAQGMYHLAHSAAGEAASAYHLQAGIAACHSLASDYESTDWKRILALYDEWIAVEPTPLVAMNRAVAVAQVLGPEAGLQALEAIQHSGGLEGYYLLHAVMGELQLQRKCHQQALSHFKDALRLAALKSEKAFLERKVEQCVQGADAG